jgi:hypothetical protein
MPGICGEHSSERIGWILTIECKFSGDYVEQWKIVSKKTSFGANEDAFIYALDFFFPLPSTSLLFTWIPWSSIPIQKAVLGCGSAYH